MNRFLFLLPALLFLCVPAAHAIKPTVTTLAPSAVTRTSAKLSAQANANGSQTTVEFLIDGISKGAVDIGMEPGSAIANFTVTGLLPHTTYTATSRATNASGTTEGGSRMFTTLNAQPVARNDVASAGAAPVKIQVLQNDTDEDGDLLSIISTTQGSFGSVTFDAGTVTYTPGAGFDGTDTFNYTISDSFDGTHTAQVVISGMPITTLLFAQGDPVPGEPEGITFTEFGSPALADNGLVAFRTSIGSLSIRVPALFAARRIVARQGGQAPDQNGAVSAELIFREFRDPVINGEGAVAFIATVTSSNGKNPRMGIWTTAGDGTLELVALQGEPAPGGIWAGFRSLSLQRGHLLFTALLKRGGGVTAPNDFGAWSWTAQTGVTLEIREGVTQVVTPGGTKTVKLLALFPPVAQSLGQGRSHVTRAAGGVAMTARVTFTDRSQAILVNEEGTPAFSLEALAVTGMPVDSFNPQPSLPAVLWKSFGFPTWSQDGTRLGVLAAMQDGDVKASSDTALFVDGNGGRLILRNREGEAGINPLGEPLPGTVFAGFKDPLIGALPVEYVFMGKLKGAGVNAGNDEGIWRRVDGRIEQVARERGPIDGVASGDRWKRFYSVALGSLRGPLFVTDVTRARGTSTFKTQRILWSVDSRGRLLPLLGQGDLITANLRLRTVKNFSALLPSKETAGVRTSFSSPGDRVAARVEFTDRTTALVSVSIP